MSWKKRLILLLVIIIVVGNGLVGAAIAQEASSSAQIEEVIEASESAVVEELEVLEESGVGLAENVVSEPLDVSEEEIIFGLSESPQAAGSARVDLPSNIRSLRKRTYRSDEEVTVVVDNASLREVGVTIYNPDGETVEIVVEEISLADPVVLRVLPRSVFKAGRYLLRVTTTDGAELTQDFNWGVLAINANKSIYTVGDEAELSIAVLNEAGLMVCDAEVELVMRNSEAEMEDVLSTVTGGIWVNSECEKKEFTLVPDYEAKYVLTQVGTYEMFLRAITPNGEYSITDAIEVRESVKYDVSRMSATRLYPPEAYPMEITIKANEDFDGWVYEYVPGVVAVEPLAGVQKYDYLNKMTSVEVEREELEAQIFGLMPPFDDAYPVTLRFGEWVPDEVLRTKYDEAGVIGHDGVDFALPEGTPVLAADSGEVVRVDPSGDYGGTVVIQHEWGKSYYGHLSEITTREGKKIVGGHPLGLSGRTGLATGPHLHFGIKPNNYDMNNGYYGKINPLPYLEMLEGNQDVLGEQGLRSIRTWGGGEPDSVQVLIWRVNMRVGEMVKLGYQYRVPSVSPQFYLMGPLTMERVGGERVFQEVRKWQLAVDADGSGTNTVDPTTEYTDATGKTYTFTFTAGETMDSGEFTVLVPAGWSEPQGTGGVAGYTTVTGNGNATVADVWNSADSITGWEEDDTDMCNSGSQLSLDNTVYNEGSGSIKCDNSSSVLPDNNDSFSYELANQDWSGYSQIGVWVRTDANSVLGDWQIAYDNNVTCSGNGELESFDVSALTADTWTYEVNTLTATRTDVDTFCIISGHKDNTDNDIFWVDEVLLGPGTPTFSGSGPWTVSARILDAANTETFTLIYGDTAGGGGSMVTNSSSASVHTFTTKTKIIVDGTLTDISAQPTVTLEAPPSGPTMDQVMRHGNWFNASGVEQAFTF